MTAPAARNITIYAGDDYDHEITVQDSNEQPVDLSDRTWAAQWRADSGAADAVAFSVDANNAATGVLVLSLTDDQTASLAYSGVWDLQGTFIVDGKVETLLRGKATTTKDVTRS